MQTTRGWARTAGTDAESETPAPRLDAKPANDSRREPAGWAIGCSTCSVRQIEAEAGRPPRQDPLALGGDFARLLAVLAADGEGQRPQAARLDFLAALETAPVGAFFEPFEGLVDAVERLGLHLDQGELDLVLDVR